MILKQEGKMSGGNYKSCEVCGGKTFYDADVDYCYMSGISDSTIDELFVEVKALCPKCQLKYELVVVEK